MSFFGELKRRNVIRVAAAYIVIGWLLLQVADTLTPALHLPDWMVSAIALLLMLGIVPVLLFSWAYELTPEGLKRDSEVDKATSDTSQTAKKLDVITIVAVVGIALLIGWQQFNPPTISTEEESQAKTTDSPEPTAGARADAIADASIAVLPFADLSPGSDQSHFSDGIAEEILNVLVRIESLKVASRTSAFGFKGQESLGIPLIAERLKVRHVLEGSVRKSGDTVRITAQLIDAQTDAHLWSETFDRKLTTENIFAVQDEIAGAIVTQLGALIGGDQGATRSSVKVTTESVDAYETYLKAQRLFHIRSGQNLPEIIALYEQAVAIDPDFAEAWAGLSAANMVAPGWNLGPKEEFYPAATEAADRATALDESLSLPYAVRGSVIQNDVISSMEQLDIAVQREPSNIQSIYFRAAFLLELGYLDRTQAEFERCLELDANYEICRRFLSFVLLFQGDIEQANKLFEIGLLRGQSSYEFVFADYYGATGDTRALALLLVSMFDSAFTQREAMYRFHTDDSYSLDAFSRDFQANTINNSRPSNAPILQTVESFSQGLVAAFFWSPYSPIRRRPELHDEWLQVRKALIAKKGIDDYWRKYGFPAQCRPIGDDDFECD